MSHHTKLDEKLEGAGNFRAWTYRISLALEQNELDSYISDEVLVPKGDEAKGLHKKNLVMEKSFIGEYIKDHLIPQVSSLKTPKAMFDALTKLFEGKNINWKMTLRNQLKSVKIQNAKTIQYYFTRVSQIKEQLEAIDEEVENVNIVMTTLNGLPRSWDSFFQGICARKKLVKFSRLWEECSQEEARKQLEKRRWEVKNKFSRYTPSQPKEDLITPEVSALTKITLEKNCLESYVIHVMK